MGGQTKCGMNDAIATSKEMNHPLHDSAKVVGLDSTRDSSRSVTPLSHDVVGVCTSNLDALSL